MQWVVGKGLENIGRGERCWWAGRAGCVVAKGACGRGAVWGRDAIGLAVPGTREGGC